MTSLRVIMLNFKQQLKQVKLHHGAVLPVPICSCGNLELYKDFNDINIYYGTSLGRISKLEFDSEVKGQDEVLENQMHIDYNDKCKSDNPSIKQMIVNGTDLIISFENFIVTKGLQCKTCR